MSRAIVVTGTDTGIGKTVAAAALVRLLDADYWKPVQAGLDGETDRDTVIRLAAIDPSRAHRETYRLATACSPHRAAEIDGVRIEEARLMPPALSRLTVIEGAGGLMVPLRRDLIQIDVFATWAFPVVIVTSTRLGTINHTLLSVEALRTRGIAIAGLLFSGERNDETMEIIGRLTGARILGRLPHLDPLDATTLAAAATEHLQLSVLRAMADGAFA